MGRDEKKSLDQLLALLFSACDASEAEPDQFTDSQKPTTTEDKQNRTESTRACVRETSACGSGCKLVQLRLGRDQTKRAHAHRHAHTHTHTHTQTKKPSTWVGNKQRKARRQDERKTSWSRTRPKAYDLLTCGSSWHGGEKIRHEFSPYSPLPLRPRSQTPSRTATW